MDLVRRGIAGPEPTAGTRRFEARLRLYVLLLRFIRQTDGSDILTLVSLAMLFTGLALPSAAFGVVGGLLVLLTPIGTALRVFVRGR